MFYRTGVIVKNKEFRVFFAKNRGKYIIFCSHHKKDVEDKKTKLLSQKENTTFKP